MAILSIGGLIGEEKWFSRICILRCDVYGGGRERARYFGGGKKCNNCNQTGHLVGSRLLLKQQISLHFLPVLLLLP